jgi:hypothetical protein
MDAYQFDDMDARPCHYKKTPIRHSMMMHPSPSCVNGMIYHFRVQPAKPRSKQVMWKINYLKQCSWCVVRKDITR